MKLSVPLLLFVLVIFTVPAVAQRSLDNGAKVDGVALDASYKTIVAKFGKPLTEKTNKMDECIGDRTRSVNYPGLHFDLVESTKVFKVFGFEVTSSKYLVSGIRVGAAKAEVEKAFGKRKRAIEKTKTGERWFYNMTDESPGSTTFDFKNGKLVKIIASYMMC